MQTPREGAVASRLVHEALVYSSEEAFLARLVPFLRDGVDAGQPTIVVLAPKKVALLRDALGHDADRISFADPTTLYRRPAHAIAEYRCRLDEELSRPGVELLRVVGEVPFGSTAQEHAAWTRYEWMFNCGLATYPSWVVCGYDARALPEQVVADALRTHPLVSTGGKPDASAGYVEDDELVERPSLRAAERAAGGDPLVLLEVSEERELDGLRQVVAGTARAAGLEPEVVDDVTIAVGELVRDAIRRGEGGASVQIARDGARWHCEITGRDSDATTLDATVGLSIARLVGDRVELGSQPGRQTVRMTLAGAADARERILHAASELFYQNGIRGSGINTIIAHSGVAKATFFHHFPAKNDLVIAWLRQPASRWFDRIRAQLDTGTESPASSLLTFFDLLGEWFAQDDFRGCAFQNAAAETPEAAHPIRRTTHDYTLEIREYLRRLATDAGLSDPARIAAELHLLAQGAIATAVATGSADAAKVARAAAARILTPAEPTAA